LPSIVSNEDSLSVESRDFHDHNRFQKSAQPLGSSNYLLNCPINYYKGKILVYIIFKKAITDSLHIDKAVNGANSEDANILPVNSRKKQV
jgi:hypothetical protein